MKKRVFVIFAWLMVLTLSLSAVADTISTGEKDIDVEARYQDSTTVGTVYSVDISWGTMQFTYTERGTKEWNPDDHSYTESTTTSWTASGNTVTVVNHSNAEVTASFAFEALEAYNTLTGTFDVASKSLKAGAVGGYDTADKVTAKLSLSGTLPESLTKFTKVGEITVTIS